MDSLTLYPLPVRSAEEAGELVGVGEFIAHRIGHIIDRRREEHREEVKEHRVKEVHASASSGGSVGAEWRRRRYLPKEGGAASQLLLALSSLLDVPCVSATASSTSEPAVTVTAVLRQAAALFEGDNRTSKKANVKAAVDKLTSEQLIARHSCNGGTEQDSDRLSITHLGSAIVKEMEERQRDSTERLPPAALPRTATSHQQSCTPSTSVDPLASPASSAPPLNAVLPFSLFTLHLAIDSRERRFHSHPQLPHSSLVRALPAGDFVWLLRHTASDVEYVVDLIAERKRVGDLVASVKDGRMREQRWRMKRSGMTRKLYIIEGDLPAAGQSAEHTARYSIPPSTLESILSALSVVHGYSVVRTSGVNWTVGVLGQMHRQLETDMREEGVVLREAYSEFEERMKKRGSGGGRLIGAAGDGAGGECDEVDRRQVWGSQLRMIRGISPLIAASIVSHHPSLTTLQQAYSGCASRVEEDTLLADITCGQRKRTIGGPLSRRVRDVLRMQTYEVTDWELVTADRRRDEDEQRRQKEQRRKEREDHRQRRKKEQQETRKQRARQRVKPNEEAARQQPVREEHAEGQSGGRLKAAVREREVPERDNSPLAGRQQQRTAHPDVDDESVLREMRERVQEAASEERRQSADWAGQTAGGAVGRKLTAKDRLRQREEAVAVSTVKRSRPQRGVIQVDSDVEQEDEKHYGGASEDDEEVQCWTATSTESTGAASAPHKPPRPI